MTATPKTKRRIDAWDAPLTEAQRWQAYGRMRTRPWQDVAAWVAEEFGIGEPSRSAIYRFVDRMRPLEAARRLEEALAARDEAGALVAARTDDADTIAAYKALAQDLALRGDAETARTYTRMALDLAGQQITKAELQLKERRLAQQRDAQRLAREKFEAAEARATAAETRADAAEQKNKALQERIKALEMALQEAGKTSAADPAAVAAEVDKLLGRKPQ